MLSAQEQFDEAMLEFSRAQYDLAIGKLQELLRGNPDHFDGRLALGMAYCRKGDYAAAIDQGHKAEQLRPKEPLVHTNLSLFYMKAGDKQRAEHHGLQARISSWREGGSPTAPARASDSELDMASPPPAPMKFTGRLPDMPWKKAAPAQGEPPGPEGDKGSPPPEPDA